jgi:hypothetical protein
VEKRTTRQLPKAGGLLYHPNANPKSLGHLHCVAALPAKLSERKLLSGLIAVATSDG